MILINFVKIQRTLKTLFVFIPLLLTGCLGYPELIEPVSGFNLNNYLGKWYEIARLDHSFERGLENVTAQYSLRKDGGVQVVNRGYSARDEKWKEAVGKAFFAEDSNQGYLKVSFFGPFYGSYVVFELDADKYQYAFVSGPTNQYLWLLSRTPVINDDLKNLFIEKVEKLGFNSKEIIWVKQS